MSPTDPDRERLTDAVSLESYGLELAFLVVALNAAFAIAEGFRWWNLVSIAIAGRYGLAIAIRRYQVPVDGE